MNFMEMCTIVELREELLLLKSGLIDETNWLLKGRDLDDDTGEYKDVSSAWDTSGAELLDTNVGLGVVVTGVRVSKIAILENDGFSWVSS